MRGVVLTDPDLIDRIYEAAVLPQRWPGVLQRVADAAGAMGAVVLMRSPAAVSMLPSPRLERFLADYLASGWADDPAHAAPLLADRFPGFRAETAYRTAEEIAALPVHREFLDPRGMIAGVGTLVQGAQDDAVQIAVEGFPAHAAAEGAVMGLDGIRAPLARALSLTARLALARAEATVSALELAGVGAAVVGADGALRAANDRFAARLGGQLDTARGRLRFAARPLQAQLAQALASLGMAHATRSIPVPGQEEAPPFALHLLPLRGDARDVWDADGVLILLAEAANASVPGADLLRLLFDLTPAEARLTRLLVEGMPPAGAAATLGITEGTARTHLRRIFAKTGVNRQSDLVRLLLGLGAPG